MCTGRDTVIEDLRQRRAQVEGELEVLQQEYEVLESWCNLLMAALTQHNIPVTEYPPSQISHLY